MLLVVHQILVEQQFAKVHAWTSNMINDVNSTVDSIKQIRGLISREVRLSDVVVLE